MAQITLNSTGVASNGALVLQSNGTTTAVTINSSQGVEFNAGTAALPAITTTGDTNTGIFFPAADTIAFSEGGVEAARIDSGSRLLVGLTSSIASNGIAQIGGNADTRLIIDGSSTQGIFFTKSGADNGTYRVDASGNYNWFVAGAATANMTLNSSGNLGIGTTSPSSTLHLSGTLPILTFTDSNDSSTSRVYQDNEAFAIDVDFANAKASSNLQFRIDNTERARIDSSGNVGIGTTSPSTFGLLAVKKDQIADTAITVSNQGTSNAATTMSFVLNEAGTPQGWFRRYRDGTGNTEVGFGDALLFTGNVTSTKAERARIDSSGNLLVGTTSQFASATSRLAVGHSAADFVTTMQNANASPFGMYIKYSISAPNGTSNEYIYCHDNTLRFSVMSNGGISNYSANNSNLSDEREKKNIELAPSYLNKICQIPVKTFLYIDQTDTDLNLGVIAQDVEAICPELIMESNWASKNDEPKIRKSIYQTDLQYALMKCIQEQQALITQLTARLDAANL